QCAIPMRYPWMLCQRALLCRKFQYPGNIQPVFAINKAMTRVSNTNKRYIHSKLLLQISMLVCKQLGESLPDNSKTHQRQAKMFHICFFLPKTLTLLEFLRYTLLTNGKDTYDRIDAGTSALRKRGRRKRRVRARKPDQRVALRAASPPQC